MAVISEILNRWRRGLHEQSNLYTELFLLMVLVFSSCSSINRCSTNKLKPRESIISPKFAERTELQIETFRGDWNPFKIELWRKEETRYILEFIRLSSTLQMNVKNNRKTLLRVPLQMDFRRNEMMIFVFKIGESGMWVVEVEKGDFMQAVQLTNVSLDEVDEIEVYNERTSSVRKVLFCYGDLTEVTKAQDTTRPAYQICPEKSPCPECEVCPICQVYPEKAPSSTYQADFKCEVCSPVTVGSPTGNFSQAPNFQAELTTETGTCPSCDICPSTAASTPSPVLPTCPVSVTCPKCEDCPDKTSSVFESTPPAVDENTRAVELAEMVSTGTTEDATDSYGKKGFLETNKTNILIYVLITALALSTLVMVVSMTLACKYRRKLLLLKTRTYQTKSTRWNPDHQPTVLEEEMQSLESPKDTRNSLHYHIYEDPYKLSGQSNNDNQCYDSLSAIKESHQIETESGTTSRSFQCVSSPDDTTYDQLQFEDSP